MIRNLKALGLALVAVFAMSAMAAAGAHAEKVAHFESGTGTVKVDASAEGNQTYALPGGRSTVCTTLDGSAAVTAETKPTEITSNTDVGYTNCHTTALGLSFPTTVTQEANCHYTFTAGTWTNGSADAHGSVHICGSTIDIYTNASDHTNGILRCQIHVPAQTVSGLTYTNTTSGGKMAVTIDVSGSVTETSTDLNHLGCNDHEHGTATYTGNVWIKGTTSAEVASDVTVMGTP
jgi:hypothetical protein